MLKHAPAALPRQLLAEGLGTLLLLAVVTGCGIMAGRGELPRAALLPCVAGQLTGAMLGAWLAHATFDMTLLQFSGKVRSCAGQWLAEAVATAGLLLVILRTPPGKTAAMVAAYIAAAYWFSASTSFANPAAAFGRMFNDSFAGHVLAQCAGALIGLTLHHGLRHDRHAH